VRPGMTANISIPVAASENAVAVPLAAVFTEQGERFVYVRKETAEGEQFEKRLVRIGIADYDFAEVVYGLSPGEVVSLEDKGASAKNLVAKMAVQSAQKVPATAGGSVADSRASATVGASSSTTNAPTTPGSSPSPAANRPASGASR